MLLSRGRPDGHRYQYAVAIISQLSVAVAGSAYVWLEPLTLRLTDGEVDGLQLTPESLSWLVSLIEVGCLISPPVSGWLANRFGRKIVILSTGPICLLGWFLVLVSKTFVACLIVRFLHGIAVGVVFTVTPIYTAEIAQPELRGRLSGIFQVTWYLGILYSYCAGPYLSYRDYAIVSVPLPAIFTALYAFCPETPYYLLMKGRTLDARASLASFRNLGEDIEEEFEEMQRAVAEEMSVKSSWSTLFFDKNERRAFIIVQIVSIAKFLTGMPTIVSYATETFSAGSNGHLSPSQLTITLGILLAGIGVASAFLSDWLGRKCLLLVSCFGVFVSHLLTGSYYFLEESTSTDAAPYVSLMYVGLIGYCFFSDIGLGPLLQTLQAEMFSAKTRGLAAGITEAFAALLSFAVLRAYRPVNDAFGVYVNFWFYSAVGLVGGVLLACLMFETKGKTIGNMANDRNAKL